MKLSISLRFVTALTLVLPLTTQAKDPARIDADYDARIETILAKLTLQEKIGQLRITDGDAGGTYKYHQLDEARQGLLGGTFNVRGCDQTRQMQNAALTSPNKIPLIFAFDVVHGYRTIFPVPLGEAASWDLDLAERCAAAAAAESRAANVSWVFGPVCDVARDPRWGRIVESCGEDSLMCSEFTAARVRGLQGNNIAAPDRVMACLKHFAGGGAAEGGRDYNEANVSLRQMREIYLPPFLAGVRAGAGSVMASHNAIDGTPGTCNRWLLTEILREDWKFPGIVVTDYDSIMELMNHRMASSYADAGTRALSAGVDIEMKSFGFASAAQSNRDPEIQKKIDDAVRRVLRTKFKLGLFENPYGDPKREEAALLSPAHLKLAREAAAKACVLLKNDDQTLPIPKTAKTIAIFGTLADDRVSQIGSWPGDGEFHSQDGVTLVDAIREKLGDKGNVIYQSGGSSQEGGFSFNRPSDGISAAQDADFIILAIGEPATMTGESCSKSSLEISKDQLDLLEKVQALGKPYAVVLMTGRPLVMPYLSGSCPAILCAWYGGTMAGPGIADILFGDVNPSGKLPVTFPRNVGQIPITYRITPTGRPDSGYKWSSRYTDVQSSPQWPFGFGLSYTDFTIQSKITGDNTTFPLGGTVPFRVTVTNTGKRDGEEVIQAYVSQAVSSVSRPYQELKAFKKVFVPAGKSITVDMSIPVQSLGYYTATGDYLVEPGLFRLMVSNSASWKNDMDFYVGK